MKRARRSSLRVPPAGRRTSADIVGGRFVDETGPLSLREVLSARGGEIDRYTHRFHTYPARMHPNAAAALVEALGGKRVLDPFCGGGTVLVEALVRGREVSGRDINPVAVIVATARTRLLDATQLRALTADAEAIVRQAKRLVSERKLRLPPRVYALRDWYHPQALRELGALHHLCADKPLLSVVQLSLVVKYSRRASDTSQRRVDTRQPPGAVLRAFRERTTELATMLAEVRAAAPASAIEPRVAFGDARRLDDVPPVDLVCTSPPYPATYDYVPLQELRLAWLSDDRVAEAKTNEIGSRRSFRGSLDAGYARWVDDTKSWVRAVGTRLAPGGKLAVLTGDGIARHRLLDARGPAEDAARRAGLELFAGCSIERVDPATRLAKREHALVFAKR